MGRPVLRGVMMAAGAGVSLGCMAVAARYSYGFGADPWAVILSRIVFGILGALLALRVLRQRLSLGRGNGKAVAAACLGMALITTGYMASVAFIPVGVAVLLLYSFPMQILVVRSVLDRRLPDGLRCTTFLVAFAGLALALGPEVERLDWRGVLLALQAAAGVVIMMLAGEKAMVGSNAPTITFFANLTILPVVLIAALATGGVSLPSAGLGWIGVAAAGGAYALGQILQFMSLREVRAETASLALNIEPVVSIGLAALLLGETLALTHYAGAVMVVGAIVVGSVVPRDVR